MAIFPGSAIPSAVSAYEIDNSLRFDDGDSAYLTKTDFGAGNRTTWTFSCWVKLSQITTQPNIFGSQVDGSPNNRTVISYGNGNINFTNYIGSYDAKLVTEAVYRDPSAWYHVVTTWDTDNSTEGDRLRLYVNGDRVTAFKSGQEIYPSSGTNSVLNNSSAHFDIGQQGDGSQYMDGYLAEVYFIDGTALDADSFGETNATTNQWIPKDASGLTFGTNGFYQKYGSSGGHTSFTSVGSTTWTAPEGVTSVDYLVVGGGGGGGFGGRSGGGGAGGMRTGTLSVVGGTSYTVTVGAGGAKGTIVGGDFGNPGTNGGDSVFASITSDGGGGGGARSNSGSSYINGKDGGSGGGGGVDGGAGTTGAGGSATSGQGYDGGTGQHVGGSHAGGGGGGGASAVGANNSGSSGGNGGAGLASSITGASVTYAGGGGGGGSSSSSGGSGGGGGSSTDGTDGLGGGGGSVNEGSGGDGGDGIVIVKPVAGQGFGLDSSGEGNNFTATNLVATDQMTGESPTNNFATWNPVFRDSDNSTTSSYTEGNLKWASSGGDGWAKGTVGASSGKWYWEFYVNSISGTNGYFGAVDSDGAGQSPAMYYSSSAGSIASTGETTQTGLATVTAGDIVGIAIDLDASPQTGKVYKNNVQLGTTIDLQSGNTWTPFVLNANSGVSKTFTLNCGQDSSFAGAATAQGNQDGNEVGDFYYAPPSGYLALCTSNLPDPEITLPGEHFNTILYDDGAGAKTGVGFQPDFVWVKSRGSAYEHELTDAVRGVTKALSSDSTNAESTDSNGLTAFGTDGFTVGTDTNYSDTTGSGMVAWNWKGGGAAVSNGDGDITSSVSANTTAGFSIVSYTGDGDNTSSVGHGLTTTPGMIFLKALTGTHNWIVWHKDLTATTAYSLYLNTDGAETNNVSYWYDAAPNATTFHPGDGGASNGSGTAYIAYCFESIEGYSKVGSYISNANADGPFIYTGFKPAYLLVKGASLSVNWDVTDAVRNTYNVVNRRLAPNTTGVDDTSNVIDYLSNGFKVRSTSGGYNDPANGTYIYLAFAESPFKTSNAR